MKILITETSTLQKNGDLSLDIFSNFGEVAAYENISRNDLLREAVDSEVILCNKALIDAEVFAVAEKLKYIGTFATGYNNIDIETATKNGVTVCNAAGYSTNAVAQQVICYILMHFTKAHKYNDFVKNDGWKNSPIFSPIEFSTDEVYGKTLGIVGYGSIGKAVANIAKALGMNIKVYTRTVKADNTAEFVTFEELLKTSDVLTLHCPLNDKTENLMNDETFSYIKEGAFFINTSRGGVVDEDALLKALKSGRLSGAAVDVLKTEPMSESCVLQDAPNLIITPHSAWAPLTTRKRLVAQVADNLKAFLDGKPQMKVN